MCESVIFKAGGFANAVSGVNVCDADIGLVCTSSNHSAFVTLMAWDSLGSSAAHAPWRSSTASGLELIAPYSS